MAHGFVVQSRMAALNIDSFNRNAINKTVDLDNGWVVRLDTQADAYASGLYNEVWTATQPATGTLGALWQVRSPEAVLVNGLWDGDPREFYNPMDKVFDVTYLQPKDVFVMTADALAGTMGTNKWIIAVNGAWKLTWAAAPVATAFGARLLQATTIPGSVGGIVAYKFEVVYNPEDAIA